MQSKTNQRPQPHKGFALKLSGSFCCIVIQPSLPFLWLDFLLRTWKKSASEFCINTQKSHKFCFSSSPWSLDYKMCHWNLLLTSTHYQARYIPFFNVRQYTQINVYFIKEYGIVPIAYGCTKVRSQNDSIEARTPWKSYVLFKGTETT